jgi:hypothetical protein
MGKNSRTYSRGFARALLSISNPQRFIDEVAILLNHKAPLLKHWASENESALGDKIESILRKEVKDEWEFLFSAVSHTVDYTDGYVTGSDRTGRLLNNALRAPDAHTGKTPLEAHRTVHGEKIISLVDEIVEEVSSLYLSHKKKMIIICGGPRSGKSIILSEVRSQTHNDLGVMSTTLSRGTVTTALPMVVMDDADVDTAGAEAQIEKLYINNNAIVILVCRDIGKLGTVPRTCRAKIFRIPEHDKDSIIDILPTIPFGKYTLHRDSCKDIAITVIATGCVNRLSVCIDVSVYVVHSHLKIDTTLPCPLHTKDSTLIVLSPGIGEIRAAVSKTTMVPLLPLDATTERRIRKSIENRIIGQEKVIDQILPLLKSVATGLTDPDRPAGVLFFYGHSGVGKTATAVAISDVLFDGKLYKEDMNTFSEKHSVSRIIGAPPGYVGYSEPPAFIGFIDENQRGVILLDEIEKAHESVTDLIMEMMDTGFLRDASGNRHDTRGFMIIMTSNATLGKKQKVGGFSGDEADQSEPEKLALSGVFKKEFIGRIDTICRFSKIKDSSLDLISKLLLNRLLERMKLIEIEFKVSDSLIQEVSAKHCSQTGVRGMRNYVETEVKNKIVMEHGGKLR